MQVLRGTHRMVHKHAVHTTETMILKLYVVTDMDKPKSADISSVSYLTDRLQYIKYCVHKLADGVEHIRGVLSHCTSP